MNFVFVGSRKIAVGIAISAGLLAAAAAAVTVPAFLDHPVTAYVNTHLIAGPLGDLLIADIAHLRTLSGVLFLSAIAHCWFSSVTLMRARLLAGTLASILAGLFGRFLQHNYPSHPRPLHDPGFNFHVPSSVDPGTLNAWSAFPSDHAAVWFGLATVILISRSRLGILAFAWAFASTATRNYLGFHYPTDILGGAALGSLFVWLSQVEALQRISRHLVGWGDRYAPLFYAIALFTSYQIATLFDDFRSFAGGVAKVLHLAPI